MCLPSKFLVSLVLAALTCVPTCVAHPNHPQPKVRRRRKKTTEYYEIRIRDPDRNTFVCVEAPTVTSKGKLRVRKGGHVLQQECTGGDAQLWEMLNDKIFPKLNGEMYLGATVPPPGDNSEVIVSDAEGYRAGAYEILLHFPSRNDGLIRSDSRRGKCLGWGRSPRSLATLLHFFPCSGAVPHAVLRWDFRTCRDDTTLRDDLAVYFRGDAPSDLGRWRTCAVTDLSDAFLGAALSAPLGAWDVSSVTTLRQTFRAAALPPVLGLADWDVSAVVDMRRTFLDTDFDEDLAAWDVSGVADFREMFGGAAAFNYDLSAWNVRSATSMYAMFNWASAFNVELCWEVPTGANTFLMFKHAGGGAINGTC